MTEWSTPAAIRAHVLRDWDRGQLLSARLDGSSIYPKAVRFVRPDGPAFGKRFAEVQAWIQQIVAGSKESRGRGYSIEWEEINHRQIGRNRVPRRVVVETDADAAFLIGKLRALDQWDILVARILDRFAALSEWIKAQPLVVLEEADSWDRVLGVLEWFVSNPRSGRYLREIDVEGVDTKFVESKKPLLTQLLDVVLPADAICVDVAGARAFEARYGLKSKPTRVRIRFLDGAVSIGGMMDIETEVEAIALHPLDVDTVVVVENEINFLALPVLARSLGIWGMGYAVERLERIPWLASRRIVYWGDIDTHGFGILNRLRARFPHVQSLLMDRETLMSHRALWVEETRPRVDVLRNLTSAEASLYSDLVNDKLGHRVRLEQERVRYGFVERGLRSLPVEPQSSAWVEAAKTRNRVLDDPLLDWLEEFGADHGYVKDDCSPAYEPLADFSAYQHERNVRFRNEVVSAICSCVRAVVVTGDNDGERAAATEGFVRSGAEVIVSPVLRNSRARVVARPLALVRVDRLSHVVPAAIGPVRDGRPRHVPVHASARHLEIEAQGHVRCTTELLPPVIEAWHSAHALSELQGYAVPAFVVGLPMMSVGRIDQDHRPASSEGSLAALAMASVAWLQRLQAEGAGWTPLPLPTVPELYPHARNHDDSPWRGAKRAIAFELRELTLLPGVTTKLRRQAHANGIMRWDDGRASAASLGVESATHAARTDVVLAANRGHSNAVLPEALGSNLAWRDAAPVELYVDFETAFEETQDGPQRVVQVGCGHVEDGRWVFEQWTVDRVNDSEERRILSAWLSHIYDIGRNAGVGPADVRLFHWSQAERAAYARAIRNGTAPVPSELGWTDVLEVFRATPIGVRDAFDYSLKSITRAMRDAGLISACWEDDSLDGLGAMVAFSRVASHGGKLSQHPLIARVARYNEVDCRALMEIVAWLRSHR